MIVLLVANSIRAVYVAVGEKEKRTLASLLVSNIPRRAVVIGKTLAIMSFSLFASALLVVGMVLSTNFGFATGDDVLGDLTFALSSAQVAQLAVNVGGLALLVAAVIMILGTVARSQREAGIYTSPLLFLSIFLAVFGFAETPFPLEMYAVPILGNSLAMKDTILHEATVARLAIPVFVDLTLFAFLVAAAVRLYHRETVLFRR